jgi:TolA-binding protein
LLARFLIGIIVLSLGATHLPAAESGQLDGSLPLFTVLAAINAAGYNDQLDSTANSPFRATLRKALAARNIPCLGELRSFVQDHQQSDGVRELSQYISFGLLVDGPPNFRYRLRQNELPPDVVSLAGFEKLLARFYKEADVASLWEKAQSELDAAIARYHQPLTRSVLEVSGYLRAELSGFPNYRFQVYIDLLGAPNQIQTRSYGSEYFVVLTPSPEPQIEDVRHAYLHYLLDPLASRYAEEIQKKKAVGDYALGAPFLEEFYRQDFLLLAGECVIKAVESRLTPSAGQKQALARQALGEGFVLTPHFAEQLAVYEAQDQAMRYYYPSLISSINFRKEEARLEKLEFDSQRPVRKAKEAPPPKKIEPSGPEKALQQAEDLYASRNYDRSKQAFLRLMQETTENSYRARAYYGLGRIAALQKDPELAERLFQQCLKSSPDAETAAWTHLYLGRLSDAAGEREAAESHYKAVVAIEDAPAPARQAAESGLRSAFKKE